MTSSASKWHQTGRFRSGRSPILGAMLLLLVFAFYGWSAEFSPVSPTKALPVGDGPTHGQYVLAPLTTVEMARQIQFRNQICAFDGVPSEVRNYTNPANAKESLLYRLFKPIAFESNTNYPLVLSLHGGGASGKFESLLTCESPVFSFGPARFTSLEEQERHPAFVLVPWSDRTGWSEQNCRLIVGLIGALSREFPINPKRVYVTGQSMGGFGTWQLITQYPDLFAAAVPIAGGGDPRTANKAKPVAIWAFHGSKDGIVPVSQTRNMVAALLKAGGNVTYWEYQGDTHAATAERAYCEAALADWLFAQSKP